MEKRFVHKTFIYFLCISFLLLTSGFHTMVAEAKGVDRPIGEMLTTGEVKFESREKVWKNVEPSEFPIFQGVKIKTEKGNAVVILSDDSQVEVGQSSLLSFDRNDQIRLIQGTLNFRFPSTAGLSLKVGNLTVMKYQSLHASQKPSAIQENGDTIGSIFVHSNGSLTVKSVQGSLSVINQDHVVVATLSRKDVITIPSVTASSPPKVMVAQAGETGGAWDDNNSDRRKKTLFWWLLGAAVVGGGIGAGIAIYENNNGHHHRPVCP